MDLPQHVSKAMFIERFPALLRRGWPRRPAARRILLVSAVLGLTPAREYSEAEINAALLNWIDTFAANMAIDHVTLRRLLVDEGLLFRTASGSCYQLVTTDGVSFDGALRGIDLEAMQRGAAQRRDRRKTAFAARSAGASGR